MLRHSWTMQALANRGNGGIPTRGLIYWHPLSEALSVLPTGQAVAQTGTWTYGTVSGVPCATKGNGNASILCTDGAGIPSGGSARTLSVWLRILRRNAADVCGWGNTAVLGGWRLRVNNTDGASMPPYGPITVAADLNTWRHYAAIYANGHVAAYADGVLTDTYDNTLDTPEVSAQSPMLIGAAAWQYGFCVASVRIYNRALKSSEIAALAAEHTPTS